MSFLDRHVFDRRAFLRRDSLELHELGCQCRHCRQRGDYVPARLDAFAIARLGVLGFAGGAGVALAGLRAAVADAAAR